MNKQHIINLKGKDYILFAGLLEEAHNQELESVETKLIQIPTKDNPLAIVSAVIRTKKGTFTGLGDASPENVNEFIAPHLIRMAETRALARAFRFATNIGLTAFEELYSSDNDSTKTIKKNQNANYKQNGKSKMSQADYIMLLCKSKEVGPQLEKKINFLWDNKKKEGIWPIREASDAIEMLKRCPDKSQVA